MEDMEDMEEKEEMSLLVSFLESGQVEVSLHLSYNGRQQVGKDHMVPLPFFFKNYIFPPMLLVFSKLSSILLFFSKNTLI